VLLVSSENNKLLRTVAEGVDAIHAIGTEALAGGGAFIGTIPEGSGVVGRGLNGLVGYVHAAATDKAEERDVHAGVLGEGGDASPGLFGRGSNGVVGYTASLPRDLTFETADSTGVVGLAQGVGVRGKGDNGGVQGIGTEAAFGVQGTSDLGPGVDGFSPDDTGVQGRSDSGTGVQGTSTRGIGGVFSSGSLAAQIRLQPHPEPLANPNGSVPGSAGDLLVLQQVADEQSVNLWFCRMSGNASTVIWVKIA
jgi:hypothetical protein